LLSNTENVGDAIFNLPGSMITDIATEVQNLFTDVAGGESLTAAFDATIWGWFSNRLFKGFRYFSFSCRFGRAH
jgi:hypothetical protein